MPSSASHRLRRRQILQLAAAPAGASVGLAAAPAQAQSLSLTPFLEPVRLPPQLPQRPSSDPGLQPVPTQAPNRAINPATGLPFEGRGDAHQLRELNPPRQFFVQRYGAVPPVRIHPQLPAQTVFWGANLGGANLATDPPTTPLPTIVAQYRAGTNTAILVRRHNQLPLGAPSGGFGRNQISVHLHNFHSAPDSDGGPCDPGLGALSENPRTQGRFFFPGQYYDYYHNMKRSGFATAAPPDGDVRHTLTTMWYHDHREGHTSENVYKGMYGFFIAFNEWDTGSEFTGFRFPSYPAYDIPLAMVDVTIDPRTGQASFDPQGGDGGLGNRYLVNGRIQPYMNVARRRYRFRLLNVGPLRFMQLHLTNPDNRSQQLPFWLIASDGNLLPRPVEKTSTRMTPANRRDVIIDFARLHAMGVRRVWLDNRLVQDKARGPDSRLHPAGQVQNALVEFRIGAPAADASVNPAAFPTTIPLPNLGQPALTRRFRFERSGGEWVVNGRPMDCVSVRFTMQVERTERWIFRTGGGWSHPIHVHHFHMRLLRRNGVPIPQNSEEGGMQDVLWLGEGEELELLVRPQDYLGVYPLHCHNVVHEDFAMMLLFRIAARGDTVAEP